MCAENERESESERKSIYLHREPLLVTHKFLAQELIFCIIILNVSLKRAVRIMPYSCCCCCCYFLCSFSETSKRRSERKKDSEIWSGRWKKVDGTDWLSEWKYIHTHTLHCVTLFVGAKSFISIFPNGSISLSLSLSFSHAVRYCKAQAVGKLIFLISNTSCIKYASKYGMIRLRKGNLA